MIMSIEPPETGSIISQTVVSEKIPEMTSKLYRYRGNPHLSVELTNE